MRKLTLIVLVLVTVAAAQVIDPCLAHLESDGQKHALCPLIPIATPQFPPITGILWHYQFAVSGVSNPQQTPPYQWMLLGGQLPQYTQLTPAGLLTGTPHSLAGWDFYVGVIDSGHMMGEYHVQTAPASPTVGQRILNVLKHIIGR